MPRPPAPGRLVLRMLAQADTPLLVLNGQREVLFANPALGQWLGLDEQQLVGRRCDYHAAGGDDPLAAVCAALCPPPEAFTGAVTDAALSRLATADRPLERRLARFLLLPARETSQTLLLAALQPGDAQCDTPAADSLSPQRLHAMLVKLRSSLGQRPQASPLVGTSDAVERVRQQVRIASQAGARVLVVGPPGSGRESVARAVHFGRHADRSGPLAPIDCALVDAEQMQASLAGILRRHHESPGEHPPAALLVDVDRLRPDAQQELAGFLQLPGIELGTLATSRFSLVRLAEKGRFRTDLAYELSTQTIVLPPLSKRREDIPLLAQHFLEEFNAAGGRQLAGFHPAASELLASLPWTGDLDELARAVREACERAAGLRVAVADLPDWVHLAKDAARRPPRGTKPIQLDTFLAEIERELLQRALRRTRGNKSKAAELLGLSRQRLLRRLSQLGLISPAEAEEPVVFEPLPEE